MITQPQKDLPELPIYAKPFAKVFSEREAERFPPTRSYDHPIDLKEDFQPKITKVLPLSWKQQEALKEFINDNLRKGYIRKSSSPQAAAVFFVPKKDTTL